MRLRELQETLGAEAFAAVCMEGRTLSADAAVALALGERTGGPSFA